MINLELIFFGPIIKQPVSLSLIILFISLLNLLDVRSSKLFANSETSKWFVLKSSNIKFIKWKY